MTTVRSDPCLARYDYQTTSAKTSQPKPKVTFSEENVEFPPSYSFQTTTADSSSRPHSADRYFPSNSRQLSSNVDQCHASSSRQLPSNVKDNSSSKRVPLKVVTKPNESQQPKQKTISNKSSASELHQSSGTKTNAVLRQKENDEHRSTANSNKFSGSSDQRSSQTLIETKEKFSRKNLDEIKIVERITENRIDGNAAALTMNDVDVNDVFVGEDVQPHNSSNLRRFLLRSSQSRQTVDAESDEAFDEG